MEPFRKGKGGKSMKEKRREAQEQAYQRHMRIQRRNNASKVLTQRKKGS